MDYQAAWLEKQNRKCINFLHSTLPERTLISLHDYIHIKNIPKTDLYNYLYDVLIKADPQNGTNCIWLFTQFKKGQFLLEDVERVKDDLTLYFANSSKIEPIFRKLGSIDYKKLKELIYPFEHFDEIEFFSIPNEDYIILYDGPYGQLYQVVTQEGSCHLGSGTKWCTAAKKDNMFNEYNKDGPLFIWYDNEIKKKYQFHFETDSYMDDRDNEIDSDLLTYFVIDHPVLKKFFLTKFIETINNKDKFMIPPINKKWRDAEAYIMQYPEYAYKYAKNILKSRWTEAEPYIMQDPQYAYKYALNILRSRWPEAEPYIMQDPEYAYYYTQDILNSRWPEAEQYIMQDPQFAYQYALNFLESKWPEAEPYIMQDPEYAYYYALYILKSRWPEAEPYIMQDPKYTYLYAEDILNSRWPEAEPYIMQNPKITYEYAKNILKSRWPEAEAYIIQNPYNAYQYALNILKSRWPEAEPYIMQNPYNAFRYAKNILKSRWLEAEPYIMQDATNAYQYAKYILKSRWPEAEPYIMQDPYYAKIYALYFNLKPY